MKLSIVGKQFLQDGHPTYTRKTGFPKASEGLGGLLLAVDRGHCLLGEGSPAAIIEAMPGWRANGFIGFTVALQPQDTVTSQKAAGLFLQDGALHQEGLQSLRAILDNAESLDMVPILRCYSVAGNKTVKEGAIGLALENLTNWLLGQGYDGLMLDLRSGGVEQAYWPALQLPRVHDLIYRVRDAVDLHNHRWRHTRRFYLGASFEARPDCLAQISDLTRYWQAIDVVFARERAGQGDVAGLAQALREVSDARAPRGVPIMLRGTGQANTLDVCRKASISWEDKGQAQAEWLAAIRAATGEPLPPKSVKRFQHRIKRGHETVVSPRKNVVHY